MIAAIVLAKNEAENLPKCLESVKWCDQIVVVDDNSTDDTVKLAKKLGASILSHPLNGNYSAQRNWALSHIKSPWVLFLDADEILSAKLVGEIKAAISRVDYKGYLLPRLDFMWGKKLLHGDVGGVKLLRLARRGAGEWQGAVHETWAIEGRVGTLKHPVYHYPHRHLADFLRRLNTYSSLRAQEFFASHRHTNVFEITLGPVFRFIYLYVIKLGFLDGTPGFIHAMSMSFYMFLVAGKLWLLSKGIK